MFSVIYFCFQDFNIRGKNVRLDRRQMAKKNAQLMLEEDVSFLLLSSLWAAPELCYLAETSITLISCRKWIDRFRIQWLFSFCSWRCSVFVFNLYYNVCVSVCLSVCCRSWLGLKKARRLSLPLWSPSSSSSSSLQMLLLECGRLVSWTHTQTDRHTCLWSFLHTPK